MLKIALIAILCFCQEKNKTNYQQVEIIS